MRPAKIQISVHSRSLLKIFTERNVDSQRFFMWTTETQTAHMLGVYVRRYFFHVETQFVSCGIYNWGLRLFVELHHLLGSFVSRNAFDTGIIWPY